MDPTLMIPSYFGGYGPPARYRQKNSPVEAKNFNYRLARTYLKHPNNIASSVAHLMMRGLGGGLVTVHAAYMEGGLFSMLAANIVISTLVGYCTCVLVWSAQKLYGRVMIAQMTYPDVMEATLLLSKWPKLRKRARCFRYVVEGTIIPSIYGSCCVYTVMICRGLKELVEGNNEISDEGDPPIGVYILSMIAPCIVICMLTDLKMLAPFALICDMFAVYLIFVTLWYGLRTEDSPLDRFIFKDTLGLFQSMGIFMFILEPITYALAVENNMDRPDKFNYVMLLAMSIYTVAMATVGFIGYWKYGESVLAPITVHYPFTPFSVALKVSLVLVLYVVYGISFSIGFDVEWFYLKRNHQLSNYWFWERLYRSLHVIVITLISYGIPNVARLMGLFGALTITPLICVYPTFIELILDWEHPGLGRCKWRLLRFIAIALFGVTIMIASTYANINTAIREFKNKGWGFVRNDTAQPKRFVYKDLNRSDINYNLTY